MAAITSDFNYTITPNSSQYDVNLIDNSTSSNLINYHWWQFNDTNTIKSTSRNYFSTISSLPITVKHIDFNGTKWTSPASRDTVQQYNTAFTLRQQFTPEKTKIAGIELELRSISGVATFPSFNVSIASADGTTVIASKDTNSIDYIDMPIGSSYKIIDFSDINYEFSTSTIYSLKMKFNISTGMVYATSNSNTDHNFYYDNTQDNDRYLSFSVYYANDINSITKTVQLPAPTTTSDANALWNPRNTVTFTCESDVGCRDLNYSLNNGAWNSLSYLKSNGDFNLLSSRDDGSTANAAWNDEEYVYLANGAGGIFAYDFNGTDFILKGSRDDGNAYGVYLDDKYIYVATSTYGIFAYDFNGTDFILKGSRDDGGTARNVWSNGEYIYLANYDSGIFAYDFNGDTFTLKGSKNELGLAGDVWGDDNYIYVANGSIGIYAYDFNGDTFISKGNRDDGTAVGVWGDENYIYVANGSSGIYAYTFNGTAFTLKGNRDDGGTARAVWGDGQYIYLANDTAGIYAYDFNGDTFTLKGNKDDGVANGLWYFTPTNSYQELQETQQTIEGRCFV